MKADVCNFETSGRCFGYSESDLVSFKYLYSVKGNEFLIIAAQRESKVTCTVFKANDAVPVKCRSLVKNEASSKWLLLLLKDSQAAITKSCKTQTQTSLHHPTPCC